jgi:hypothetical protein
MNQPGTSNSFFFRCLAAGNFAESVSKEVKLDEIKGDVLAKVVDYMNFKLKYTGSTGEIPEFPLDANTGSHFSVSPFHRDIMTSFHSHNMSLYYSH